MLKTPTLATLEATLNLSKIDETASDKSEVMFTVSRALRGSQKRLSNVLSSRKIAKGYNQSFGG